MCACVCGGGGNLFTLRTSEHISKHTVKVGILSLKCKFSSHSNFCLCDKVLTCENFETTTT